MKLLRFKKKIQTEKIFSVEAVSWDIKLERESEQGVCEDEAPLPLGKHVYHHRQALR